MGVVCREGVLGMRSSIFGSVSWFFRARVELVGLEKIGNKNLDLLTVFLFLLVIQLLLQLCLR